MLGLDLLQPGGLGADIGKIHIRPEQRDRPGPRDDRNLRIFVPGQEPVDLLRVSGPN